MTAFDDAAADLYADEDLSVAASYRRPPYTWAAVRVILSQPKDDFGNAIAGSLGASLPASQVTDTPERGDELRIGGTVYVVEKAIRDDMGLSYLLTLADRN